MNWDSKAIDNMAAGVHVECEKDGTKGWSLRDFTVTFTLLFLKHTDLHNRKLDFMQH